MLHLIVEKTICVTKLEPSANTRSFNNKIPLKQVIGQNKNCLYWTEPILTTNQVITLKTWAVLKVLCNHYYFRLTKIAVVICYVKAPKCLIRHGVDHVQLD